MKHHILKVCLGIGMLTGTSSVLGVQDQTPPPAKQQDTEAAKNEKPTPESLISEAMKSARNGDIDTAIELIEKARALDPKDPRLAMTHLGALQARAGELLDKGDTAKANPLIFKAASVARELLAGPLGEQLKTRLAPTIYEEAIAFADENKQDQALKSLEEAFELGWDDIESTRNDEHLASLKANPAFADMVNKYEKIIVERTVAETKEELAGFESFDFDFALPNLKGETINLSDFKGKVLVADFWGTWCPPCRAEIPHFVALKEELGQQGLEVIGLTYENDEGDEVIQHIKQFSEANGINYPLVIGDESTMDKVANFEGYPTTLFIDRQGKVRLQLVGLQSKIKLASVVKQLLNEGK